MRQIALIILTALFVPNLNAGTLVEPYVGYAFGTGRPTATPSSHHSGVGYGARLGYQMLGVMAGVDYQTGRWSDSSRPSNDLTPSFLGIFAGYNLPILLRGYIAYLPFSNLTSQHDGLKHTYDGGDAFKYGIGFTGLPFLSMNFEYIVAHLRAIDTETYQVTLSLPINF